jgi:hypothetical protein
LRRTRSANSTRSRNNPSLAYPQRNQSKATDFRAVQYGYADLISQVR